MLFSIINVVRSSPLQELAFRGERGSLLGEPAGSSISLYFLQESSLSATIHLRFFTCSLKTTKFTKRNYRKKQAGNTICFSCLLHFIDLLNNPSTPFQAQPAIRLSPDLILLYRVHLKGKSRFLPDRCLF